jgi:phospholipid N-methyltransferase
MADNWTNCDNAHFYENNLEVLQQWAEAGGLAACPDLQALAPYLAQSHSILEIGAGYGRVQSYLLEHYPEKKISALEKSAELYKMLQQQFQNRIELIHADITSYTTETKYDLILWLWSGLTDFSQLEQPIVLNQIRQLLKSNGKLIIETFPHDLKPANGDITATQSYLLSVNDFTLHGFIPSPEQMQCYANQAELKLEELILYTTDSGRQRKLYALSRSDTHTTS